MNPGEIPASQPTNGQPIQVMPCRVVNTAAGNIGPEKNIFIQLDNGGNKFSIAIPVVDVAPILMALAQALPAALGIKENTNGSGIVMTGVMPPLPPGSR
jgi:hypothetical protein